MPQDPQPGDAERLLVTPRFQVLRRTFRDRRGEAHAREVIEHPGAVAIVALIDAEHVCLVENYRVAVGGNLVELPAGTLEPGETPQATARRELQEETGYVAGQWEPLLEFYMSPGILKERLHLFLATDLTAGPKHLDEGEQIENLVVPWQTALEWIDRGRIEDAKTIVGLLHYDRLRRGT